MQEQILKFFPRNKVPRKSQALVLKEVAEAFESGYQNVVIEAPVGSGKSAIAVAVSNFLGTSHVLTPRKSLQSQYEGDFPGELVGMRGRSYYPCVVSPRKGATTADCYLRTRDPQAYKNCRDEDCPYTGALEWANSKNCVVHNYHSFIYQAALFGRFQERDIIIFDEAHEIPSIVRSFGESRLKLNKVWLPRSFVFPEEWDIDDLLDLLTQIIVENGSELGEKEIENLENLYMRMEVNKEFLTEDNYVFDLKEDKFSNTIEIAFTPIRVGPLCNKYLYAFGKKRLFMSGTIYSPTTYCSFVGLDPAKTKFIQIPSTVPAENRPIYLKPEYQVDTSFAKWDENFVEIVEKIKKVFEVFKDAKGLIHAPSYKNGLELFAALKDTGRVMIHAPVNLEEKLEEFYSSKGNMVFISPSCQQGVDMKYDRARFQILVRVPYPNTSDAFVNKMREDNFGWYNYQALVIFGQQLGRVVRADDDFGATILLDSRFSKFLTSNRTQLPGWLMSSIKR